MLWHAACFLYCQTNKDRVMSLENIIDSNLKIVSMADEQGRKYYSIRLAFSDNDVVSIYHNSIEELVNELPEIIGSAIQARIVSEGITVN